MPVIIERIQGESGELVLRKNEKHYEIISGGVFLMSTRDGRSEMEMVKKGLSYIRGTGPLKVLIGGLGVGYSAREALMDKRVDRVDVVELEEKVIEWNRKYFGIYNNNILENNRIRTVCMDLIHYLQCSCANNPDREKYQLIVYDIDNGSGLLVRKENSRFYGEEGLRLAYNNLSSGGILVVWSAVPDKGLLKRIESIFNDSFDYQVSFKDEKQREFKHHLYFGIA